MDESGTDSAKSCRKVGSGKKVEGVIRYFVNIIIFQLDYAMVLHQSLVVPVLMYESEAVV